MKTRSKMKGQRLEMVQSLPLTQRKSWVKVGFVLLAFLFLSSFIFDLSPSLVQADEVEELQKQIDELSKLRQMSESATKNLEVELTNVRSKIASTLAQLNAADKETHNLEASIEQREDDLSEHYSLLKARVRSYYKFTRQFSPLATLLSIPTASQITRQISYHSAVAGQDKEVIVDTTQDILGLENDKKALEQRKAQLKSLRTDFEKNAKFFEGEIQGAKDHQEQLKKQIAELSARQQEIINARSGGFTVSGDSELADDRLASIAGFRESAPGGYFAVFSFGAYSHRNGMSQYGALGRAKSGQNAEQILKAYYPGATIKTDYPVMSEIKVSGYDSMSFEDRYLMGIYEVPSSWPKEVLKAQAIAARTFAVKYTNNGNNSDPICTTESCQVFKNSPKGGSWEEAVRETKGMVLVDDGGKPVSTQYASTHGGWAKGVGWDTTDGSGGSGFLDKAYDKIGGSPWLYKAWWRAGYRKDGETCGRSNPWLSPEEMADIVNAYLVMKHGSSGELDRVSPVTTSCWGGNPYSHSELRELASKYGGISGVGSVNVTQGTGKTNSVTINGVNMSGDEFCKAFNLRAPGNLRIPQWSGSSCGGAFFNIERK